jgi:hypothetical protein
MDFKLGNAKDFVEHTLELSGRWTSQGGSSRKFICSDLDLTITWYPGKQNSLILHGKLSSDLSNILLKACQKKTDNPIVEIDAFPASDLNNGSLPTTCSANNIDNPPATSRKKAQLHLRLSRQPNLLV